MNQLLSTESIPGRRILALAAITFLGATGIAQKADASPHPSCRVGAAPYYCQWIVNRVKRMPGKDLHHKVMCVSFAKSRLEQHISCSVAKSASDQATATLGGQAPIGVGALSASVGYDVVHTTTVSTSDTVDVPPHRSGYVWWRAVYGDREAVSQQYERCVNGSSPKIRHDFVMDGVFGCQKLYAADDFAVAYTEKYVDPQFGAHLNR